MPPDDSLAPRLPGLRRLATAGALLAIVDGISAILLSRLRSGAATATRTFQGVAYALLGPSAFTGGGRSALLGVVMHIAVAFAWTGLFVVAFRTLPSLRRVAVGRAGVWKLGAPYGAAIWLTMSLVVFPLSRIGIMSPMSPAFVINLVHHILVVGPLVAFLVARPV